MQKHTPTTCPVCQGETEVSLCERIEPPCHSDYEFDCGECGHYLMGGRALRWFCSDDEVLVSRVRKQASQWIRSFICSENELPIVRSVGTGTYSVEKTTI